MSDAKAPETPLEPRQSGGPPSGSVAGTAPPERPAVGRGLPSVNRGASLQQRVSRALALGLVLVTGLGLLGWYYVHGFAHRPSLAVRPTNHAAEGEMALPQLGPVAIPVRTTVPNSMADGTGQPEGTGYIIGNVLNERPPLGTLETGTELPRSTTSYGGTSPPMAAPPVDRRLTGAAFSPAGSLGGAPVSVSATSGMTGAESERTASGEDASPVRPGVSLSAQFKTPVTPAVEARRLPTQRLLLGRGSFIDCTLETAVDSSLPGLVTCLTASDTFSADGTVVLLERGTKLVGETRGEIKAGAARVFILWTEARTPTGVVVELDSPAADALGRAGVGGDVDRHFWERFGAAILLSMIDGTVQAETARASGGTTVVNNSTASTAILEEVLKSTVNIPPTVTIAAGTRVQALVARDVDFRSVYALKSLDPASGG